MVLPSLERLPIGCGRSALAPNPTSLCDLVMAAPPAFSPRAANVTLPAHKLTDGRLGPETHSAGTYSA
eukprot:1541498-Pyramimonas_sp.AAC.1